MLDVNSYEICHSIVNRRKGKERKEKKTFSLQKKRKRKSRK